LDSETNLYAKTLRVGFTLGAYPAPDIKQLAEKWSSPEASSSIELWFDPIFRQPLRILVDPGLLPLHPMPFDEIADLNWAILWHRTFRTNSMSPWKNRSFLVEQEMAKNARALVSDLIPLMRLLMNEPLPLNRLAIAKGRDAYLAITNPIGRIMQCSRAVLMASDRSVFESRTGREAVRALVAVKIFEHRKGQLPASLRDLVDQHLLDSLPMDYFSGEPLKYSQTRRVIWSVGANGIDDGGNQQTNQPQADAVFKIPETLRP
jgi:hypothetical protein